MQRFYVPPENIKEDNVLFTPDQSKHINRVLRMKKGAEVAITDGNGKAYLCLITSTEPTGSRGMILKELKEEKEPSMGITLYQGMAKGDKMDTVIQKSVEIGAVEIVPFISRRTVVRIEKEKSLESRLKRWKNISISALEQSGRNCLPNILKPLYFEEALKRAKQNKNELIIMAWEEEKKQGLKELLSSFDRPPAAVSIFVGPEGGFAPGEVEDFKNRGGETVSLGRRIVRTETAGLLLLALTLYHFDELG